MTFTLSMRHSARLAFCVALLAAIGGCDVQSPARTAHTVPSAASASPAAEASTTVKAHNLTIYGYNYTDTGIGSFEVNGQGGGNLQVSEPTAGGGKSTCCATVFSPYQQPKKVKIKWTRDLETWCEQEVVLYPPLPAKPEYFEVHFYRDGHIELAVTEVDSPPRLRLQASARGSRHEDEKLNVNNDSKFARCTLGYR